MRVGAKGEGGSSASTWDEALTLIAERLAAMRAESGGESILPLLLRRLERLLTQDGADALLFRRLGASRLARTVCAAPTGAANQALYGKMAVGRLPGLSRTRG